jgi:hypothetical protein
VFSDRLPNSGTAWVIEATEPLSNSENEEQPLRANAPRIDKVNAGFLPHST